MNKLAIKFHTGDKNSWGCAADNCNFVQQGNAQLDRVLKHATTCKHLQIYNIDLWKDALEESGQGLLGAQIAAEGATSEPPTKRSKNQSTLDLGLLRQTGQKAKEEQCKLFQAKVDHVIMKLICIWGLVPHIIDSGEWKELMYLLNGAYEPTSADVFAKKHIPREAVYVHQQQAKILSTIDNLTLTFDGNTTQKPHLIYTAHATTPSRDLYFLDAHEGSDEQQTTEWVTDKLLKVCLKFYYLLSTKS